MATNRRQASPIAAKKAAELIDELCVDSPEQIDIEAIALSLNAAVVYRDLRHEQGRLVRTKGADSAVISIRQDLRGTPQGRFVTAHEIGHFQCHPQLDQFKLCSSRDMSDYWSSGIEAEANQFAAELLMPRRLFEHRCGDRNPSLQAIRDLASEFRTSLMATGIRFVRFSPAACAFVFSRHAEIVWAARSDSFSHFLAKGRRLTAGSGGSIAADLHAGETVHDRSEPTDAENWTDSPSAIDRSFWEHSISLGDGALAGVLTMLWDREA